MSQNVSSVVIMIGTLRVSCASFCLFTSLSRKRSGSVVECLTRDQRAAGLSLTGVTVLCPLARHIYPRLVLVQPRKTHPYISERLLMGRKESNQTNKTSLSVTSYIRLIIIFLFWPQCRSIESCFDFYIVF